jgi:hypothetical protein
MKGQVMHKEVAEIAKKLRKQGWLIEFRPGAKHEYVAVPPDPSMRKVPLPSTPGRGRWKQNLIAQLRRAGADI